MTHACEMTEYSILRRGFVCKHCGFFFPMWYGDAALFDAGISYPKPEATT
jgi:hypothetical protein